MRTSGTVLGAVIALSVVAVGCGSSPDPVPERVVTTTRTTVDDGYGYRRRPGERLYEARVTSVRAILGPTEQRCWIERERVSSNRGATAGGAIAGAIVGGILGHQIGSGRGNDAATVGGAIAGGAIGAKAGQRYADTRDVKKCETVSSDNAEYYDVTYDFKGIEHHVQLTDPPGRYIMVNSEGEPRV